MEELPEVTSGHGDLEDRSEVSERASDHEASEAHRRTLSMMAMNATVKDTPPGYYTFVRQPGL